MVESVGLRPDPELELQRQYGAAVKSLRKSLGRTREECASAIGQSVQSWQNYEWGRRRFDRALIAKCAKGLDVDIETLEMERARLFPPSADLRSAGLEEGERLYFTAPLSQQTAVRIVTRGKDLGEDELDRLIRMLEIQRTALKS